MFVGRAPLVESCRRNGRRATRVRRGAAWVVGIIAVAAFVPPTSAQQIVAHRGASADAPENTAAAIRLAFEHGADAAEADFWLTRDGRVICLHDADAKRVAGVDVPVAESTFAELRRLDVGRWKDPRFAGLQMPSFAEALAAVPRGKKFLVEIKCGPEIVPALQDELNGSRRPLDDIIVISFHRPVIRAIRQALPTIRTYYLANFQQESPSAPWTPPLAEVIAAAVADRADGVSLNANPEVVDAAAIAACRRAELSFHVWTVDDVDAARHWQSLGVDSITTNRPRALCEALFAKQAADGATSSPSPRAPAAAQ